MPQCSFFGVSIIQLVQCKQPQVCRQPRSPLLLDFTVARLVTPTTLRLSPSSASPADPRHIYSISTLSSDPRALYKVLTRRRNKTDRERESERTEWQRGMDNRSSQWYFHVGNCLFLMLVSLFIRQRKHCLDWGIKRLDRRHYLERHLKHFFYKNYPDIHISLIDSRQVTQESLVHSS